MNSNIYTYNAANVLTTYAPFVKGNENCMLAAIGSHGVNDAVRNAMTASAQKLEYGTDCIAWIDIHAFGDDEEHSEEALGAHDLHMLLEGIDPVAIIALDEDGARLIADAYASTLHLDAANRVHGRTVVAFSDFASMLNSETSKQRAWNLLKQL